MHCKQEFHVVYSTHDVGVDGRVLYWSLYVTIAVGVNAVRESLWEKIQRSPINPLN